MKKTHILLTLYIGALYASNLLWGKLIALPFLERGITVAIVTFPLLFLITDVVGEVYGKQKSKEFVHLGMFSLVMLLIWQVFSVFVHGVESNDRFIHFNEAYTTVFGLSISFTIASLVAYIIGQYVDVSIFHFIKSKRGEKNLWLRNNLSTIVAQFVDTSVWTMIAFAPKLWDWTFNFLSLYATIIIPYWIAKIIIALVDTPLVYLGVQRLKKGKKK